MKKIKNGTTSLDLALEVYNDKGNLCRVPINKQNYKRIIDFLRSRNARE